MRIWVNEAEVELTPDTALHTYLLQRFPPPETTYVLSGKEYISKARYRDYILQADERLTIYRIPSGG